MPTVAIPTHDSSAADVFLAYRQASDYMSPSIHQFWWWHTELLLREITRVRPLHKTLVDFGCGDGYFMERVAREVPTMQLVGVDCSTNSLNIAQAACARSDYGQRISLVRADLASTPLASASADIAVCSEVVEHLLDDTSVLREIYRVMRPGGVLLLTTPNAGNFPSVLKASARRLLRRPMRAIPQPQGTLAECGHINEQSARYWRDALQATGFHVRAVLPVAVLYGSPWIDRHPLLLAALLLVQAVTAGIPGGYHISHGVIIRAEKSAL